MTDGGVMMRSQAGPGGLAPRRPPARRRRRRSLVLVRGRRLVALRCGDPPCSAFMAGRQADAGLAGEGDFRIAHDWGDLDAMAASLPVALIAAEDQNFASHSGFDLEAIRKARER